MSCPFSKEEIRGLKQFIQICQNKPGVMRYPELSFFKEYIQSLGGVIPDAEQPNVGTEIPKQKPPPPPPSQPAAEEKEEDDIFESDVELDLDGVVPPDEDEPQKMGPTDVGNVTEDDMDASNEKKSQAVGFYSEGDYQKAVDAYTDAIMLNPRAAMLYAKRGQAFLALKKPNACVRDCNMALELNPDCAAAYKFRGRARRLLGDFLQAAADLRSACKLDYDDQTDEWLKEVTPNARKLEEHNRKYERLRSEQKIRQARSRAQKARDARAKAHAENATAGQEDSRPGGAGIPPELFNLLNDPDFTNGMKDPEIAAAFKDIQQNPANMMKHQSNPKVAAFMMKLAAKLGGGGGGLGGMMGGLGGMFGGMGGGGGSAGGAPPAKDGPAGPADIDVD